MAGEWREIPLAQLLAEPVRNGIYKKKEFQGRGTKIVNMGELFAHPRLPAVPMKRVELSESEADRFLITAGDLLFARRSLVAEGAGKCCVVLDVDEPTTFESSIIRVRLDSTKADYLYLYYFFNSALGLYHLDTIRRQVAVAGITGSDLAKLEIPVPPPTEQRAIAHVLGTLDDKIELNRRMNETLEAMARALFKSWFIDFDPVRAKAALRNHSPLEGESANQGRSPQVRRWGDEERSQDERLLGRGHPPPHHPSPRGSASATPPQGGSDWTVERARAYLDSMDEEIADLFPNHLVDSELGPIPEGWEVGCFGDVVEQMRDKENPLASPDDLFHHFSIPAFDEDQWPKIERGGNIKSQKSRVPPGTVLLSKLNPEIERVWLVDINESDQAVCSTEFLVLRPRPPYGRSFTYCLGHSPAFLQKLSSLVTGTSKSHQRAQANAVLTLPVVLCPKPLAELFERKVAAFLLMTQVNRQESRSLSALRDALLPKLVAGELRVPVPRALSQTCDDYSIKHSITPRRDQDWLVPGDL